MSNPKITDNWVCAMWHFILLLALCTPIWNTWLHSYVCPVLPEICCLHFLLRLRIILTGIIEIHNYVCQQWRRRLLLLPLSTIYYPANSAFHPSGVGKWGPASSGKEKAGMVHFVIGWMRGVQVQLWALRTRAIPEHLRGVSTTKRYTNPRLPIPLPYYYHSTFVAVGRD